MHYVGMAAATFKYDSSVNISRLGDQISGEADTFMGSLVATNVVLWVLAVVVVTDLRKNFMEKVKNLRNAEEIITRVAATQDSGALK